MALFRSVASGLEPFVDRGQAQTDRRAQEAHQRLSQAGATGGPSASYAGRIMARIKPNIVFTDPLDGNPIATVEVRLAPDGTIIGKRLVKSSGVGQYWIGADSQIEQQPVDHGLVLVRDVGDGRRQREDHVVILHRQQIGLPGFEPTLGSTALALRAVPVAARVGRDLIGAAAPAAQDMATQRRAAALLYGRHHLELAQAQVAALRGTPGGSMNTEDVGNLQGGLRHNTSLKTAAGSPAG
jgi:hypothetical protein